MDPLIQESFGIIPLRFNHQWEIFIILHKQGNHWGFPKGKSLPKEDPKESAIRELQEETGLHVEHFLQEEPIKEEYTFYSRGQKVYKKVSYFPAIVSGALLLQPEEIRDGKWLSIEEAKELLTFEEAKMICERVKQFLKNFPSP